MARVLFHVQINDLPLQVFLANRSGELPEDGSVIQLEKDGKTLAAMNEQAESKGMSRGMDLEKARETDEKLVIVERDRKKEKQASRDFFDLLRRFGEEMEILSPNQGLLDVTQRIREYQRPLDLAFHIQNKLREKTGLECSIGIGPTRFLAQVAAEMKKPAGIQIIRRSDISEKLWNLPVEMIPELKPEQLKKLQENEWKRIGDIVRASYPRAEAIFQNQTGELMDRIQGKSSDLLVPVGKRKSFSASRRFSRPVFPSPQLERALKILCDECFEKSLLAHLQGNALGLVMQGADGEKVQVSNRYPADIRDAREFFQGIWNLLVNSFPSGGIVGVTVRLGSLHPQRSWEQPVLFEAQDAMEQIMDRFNSLYDSPVLKRASDLLEKKGKDE